MKKFFSGKITSDDTPEVYFATDALSSTEVRELLKCEAAYKAYKEGAGKEQTDDMLCGSVMHTLVLEPHDYQNRYALFFSDGRTKEGRAERNVATEKGLQVITPEIHDAANNMSYSILGNPTIQSIFKQKDVPRELSIYWAEEVEGIHIKCKARIDILPTFEGLGLAPHDLKKTKDASPAAISKTIANYGYHIQAAWYIRGLRAVGKNVADVFCFIFVEDKYPYIVTPIFLEHKDLLLGQIECDRAIKRLAIAKKTNSWPCYSLGGYIEVGMPHWAYRERSKTI